MGSEGNENFQQLIFATGQEFYGSLFMYLLFFPIGAILGDTFEGWVFHFIAVICFDILTAGACANPAVCAALYFSGKLSFIGAIVRIGAELLAGIIGFFALQKILPESLIGLAGGPELSPGIDVFYGAMMEGFITFIFALTVLLASTFLIDPELCRPLFAAVLRILIQFAGPATGANMNSMVGFAWAWHTNRVYSQEYQIVYIVSPLLGGFIAASVYNLIILSRGAVVLQSPKLQHTEKSEELQNVKKTPEKVVKSKKGKSESAKKTTKTPPKTPKNGDITRSTTRSQTAGPELRKRTKQ